MNLSQMSANELQELSIQIAAEQQTRVTAARTARSERLTPLIDTILLLVSEHSRISCSDESPMNVDRCTRCTLLEMKAMNWWDPGYELDIVVRRVDQ